MRNSNSYGAMQEEQNGASEERLRQLVRLRAQRGRIMTVADEDRLLEDAVTRLGVSLDRARGILHSEIQNSQMELETDLEETIIDLVKALAGNRKRLSRHDFEAVATFDSGRRKVPLETSRQTVKRLMREEDILPRRAGILPSKRWYNRIKV